LGTSFRIPIFKKNKKMMNFNISDSEFSATGFQIRIPDFRFRVLGDGIRIISFRIPDSEFQITENQKNKKKNFKILGFKFQILDSGFSDSGFQIPDSGYQILVPDSRFWTPDIR